MVALILIAAFLSFNLFNQCSGGYPCLNLKPMTDFDVEKYMGIWYGTARLLNEYDVDCKCNVYNFTKLSNGIHLDANTERRSDNSLVIYYPIFTYLHDPSIPEFNTTTKEIDQGHSFHMTLVETDYLTYQFLYGCDDKYRKDYAWVATRERHISDQEYEKLISVAKKYLTKNHNFERIDQTDCNN